MGKNFFTAVVAAMVCVAGSVLAGDVKLQPGVPVEFEVAGAPPSLANLKRGNQEPVRMTIKLPAGYKSGRSYPVLVFLNGGDGGMGGELNMADPFLGGGDYILCNMPLFKRDIQGKTDDEQLVVTPRDDTYLQSAYMVLFDELRRLVPNIDASRSVLAGFSNGAYTIAVLLWSGNIDILDLFSSFVLVEGGFWLALDHTDVRPNETFEKATFEGLRGKRILLMYGEQTSPPDRIPWNANARKTAEVLKQRGFKAEALAMPDTGHDFPPAAMAKARAWLESGL